MGEAYFMNKHEIIKVCEYVLWLNRKVTINRLIVYPPFPHVPNGEANKCRGDRNPSLPTQKKNILSLSTFNWILMPKPKSTKKSHPTVLNLERKKLFTKPI